MKTFFATSISLMIVMSVYGQHVDFGYLDISQAADDITAQMSQAIQDSIDANRQILNSKGLLLSDHDRSSVLFEWPLKLKPGLTDPGYYSIYNFVDQDPANPGFLLDYNCGTRTYDISGYNHSGTDIVLWPFPWYQMDSSQVLIIAAAAGTIVYKSDGNFDRSCTFNSNPANAVYIQHADGSVAWYYHMKSGSVTTKSVGQTVALGEYLGTVGSSGSSTLPHLHFEVHDVSNALIDPWAGSCNSLNSQSWWVNQKPYYESAVNKVMTHFAPPSFPACPTQEILNQSDDFCTGATAYFATYFHDQQNGQNVAYEIDKPDGSIWHSWSNTFTAYYQASYWYYSWTLPTNGPVGVWKFKVTFLGNTYEHPFNVYVNPPVVTASGSVNLCAGQSVVLTSSSITGNNWSNGKTTQSITVKTSGNYSTTVTNACGTATSNSIAVVNNCATPGNLSTSAITASTATLNWTAVTCAALAYNLNYRIKGTSTWTNVNIAQGVSTYNLSGLSATTKYQWRMRSQCSSQPTTWSAWSPNKKFTTSHLKNLETTNNELSFSIYPNPANNIMYYNISGDFENGSLFILDAAGKQLLTNSIVSNSSGHVDIQSLPSGVYFVQLRTASVLKIIKLIKI